MDDPVCSEVNDGLRSPAIAAASADAEGVMRGIGEEIAFSLFGLGSGRWAFSIVGVPMRVGFEKSFFLDDSFFSLPVLRGVGKVYCEGWGGVRASGWRGGGCGIACGCGCGDEGGSLSRGLAKTAAAEIIEAERGDEAGDGAVAERFRCCDACIAYAAGTWGEAEVGTCGWVDWDRMMAGSK